MPRFKQLAASVAASERAWAKVRAGRLGFKVLSVAPTADGRVQYILGVPHLTKRRRPFGGGAVYVTAFGSAVLGRLGRLTGITVTLEDMVPNVVVVTIDPIEASTPPPDGASLDKVQGLPADACLLLQELIDAQCVGLWTALTRL